MLKWTCKVLSPPGSSSCSGTELKQSANAIAVTKSHLSSRGARSRTADADGPLRTGWNCQRRRAKSDTAPVQQRDRTASGVVPGGRERIRRLVPPHCDLLGCGFKRDRAEPVLIGPRSGAACLRLVPCRPILLAPWRFRLRRSSGRTRISCAWRWATQSRGRTPAQLWVFLDQRGQRRCDSCDVSRLRAAQELSTRGE